MKTHNWVGVMFTLILLADAHSVAAQDVSSVANATSPETSNSTIRSTNKRGWRYKIHPSDTFEISFELTPEFNQTVTVQPDGYITLRDVGDVPAVGKTLPELTEVVKIAYSKLLHEPIISVDPKDFEKPYYVVGGQVGKPGKFDWRGELTLTQSIAVAGGFTDVAKHSQVLLFRRISDQWVQAKLINVKKMLRAGNLEEDPILQPGDMVYVPKNLISKIKPFLPVSSLGAYANPMP